MTSAQTIYLNNYQAPAFSVETVYLDIDLYDDHALVRSRLQLKRQHVGALHLYGKELELISIHRDGQTLTPSEYRQQDQGLIIDHCPDTFELALVTKIYPQNNTELSGLYRSHQLFCTQCEAEGFRRITYFPDRPDVLAVYTTKISADAKRYPVLLSNGNLIDQGTGPSGRHWALWHDPFKKPSYLFALVAGNLAFVQDTFLTASKRRVDLRIYVEPGFEDQCAHAMASLKKAMRWDEEVYGREYDLDILMIVAVSDFNMGAMENKGLNLFNAKYILARPDTATDQDFADIESVIGHEYFHNWTGNRVTCRDWFQLSLKEGLTVFRDQEFSRDMNSRDVNRLQDVKSLLSTQFPEDASAMAHPVRPESYQEINNFYTATIYNKGAEVIRMQHTLLGKEGFRRGMDLYFARHDGQAVTIDDFVAAMEEANEVDLQQFKRWYNQAGTPSVRIQANYQEGCLELSAVQHCPETPEKSEKKPFHIPIQLALFDEEGKQLPIDKTLWELKETAESIRFTNLKGRPVVSLLREFSAPIHLEDNLTQEDRLFLMRHETDGYAKWNAAQCLINQDLKRCAATSKPVISKPLLLAMEAILNDERLDLDLRAELLTPPGFEEVIASWEQVDVAQIEALRDTYRQQLGLSLYNSAEKMVRRLSQAEDNRMEAKAFGRRKLRNLCLWLMMKADESRALPYCQQQFANAKTMSDQIASFSMLVNSPTAHKQAVDAFYKQWSAHDLVLDKWLSVQACCELPDTLTKVKGLLQHPSFDLKNPNKIRALIASFSQGNPRHFHNLDGSGYRFLTDMLIQIDKLNPQIAARLATPFTRWQRFDLPRQALMEAVLNELSKQKLSRDLQEVVSKSLACVN